MLSGIGFGSGCAKSWRARHKAVVSGVRCLADHLADGKKMKHVQNSSGHALKHFRHRNLKSLSESPEESISLIRDMPSGTSNAENQKLSPKQQHEKRCKKSKHEIEPRPARRVLNPAPSHTADTAGHAPDQRTPKSEGSACH